MIALFILSAAACYGIGHALGSWSQRRKASCSLESWADRARKKQRESTWDELTTRIEKKPAKKRKR